MNNDNITEKSGVPYTGGEIKIEHIQTIVAEYFDIPYEDIFKKTKKKEKLLTQGKLLHIWQKSLHDALYCL
jgi:hypothetical protein